MTRPAEYLNIKHVREQQKFEKSQQSSNTSSVAVVSHHSVVDAFVGHDWLISILEEYVLKQLSHLKSSSLMNEIKAFKMLWKFLDYDNKSGRSYGSISDIDPLFMGRLISWMSGIEPVKTYGDLTKATSFNVIRRFFDWLKYEKRLLPQDWPIRNNPWPFSHKKSVPRKPLSEFEIGLIMAFAKKEIEKTLSLWDSTNALLDDVLITVPDKASRCSAYKHREVALKSLITTYPGSVPERSEIHNERPGLERAITSYEYLTMKDFIESRYPTARTLVPFIVVIGMASFLNPDTLLGLKWSEVEESHPIFGNERWQFIAKKDRSGRLQRRSFPAKVTDVSNPVYLLRRIKEQTQSLRVLSTTKFIDHVFLFHNVSGTNRVSVFVDGYRSITWDRSLKSFIRDNNLPKFGLATLRVTGSDMVDVITDGDIKAQQLMLNHATIGTTEKYYTSLGSRQRREEKLARAMAWRERFARSSGKADARGRISSRDAATPGYSCFDPYDSEIEGQITGRLCTAYGRCPTCPLKGLNIRSPQGLAYLLQLRSKLLAAKYDIAPERWISIWAHVYNALNEDIKLFSSKVMKWATNMTPPKLPEIE